MKNVLICFLGALVLFALLIPEALKASPPSSPPRANSAQGSNPASIIAKIHVGNGPKGLAVNENTNQVYIALYGDNRVALVDGASNTVISSQDSLGIHPNQVAFSPSLNRVFVTNRDSDEVAFLDAVSLKSVGWARTGRHPWGVTVDGGGSNVFVANFDSSDITVAYGAGGNDALTSTFALPVSQPPSNDRPTLAAYSPNPNLVYVAGWDTGNLYVIDSHLRPFQPMSVGFGTLGVGVDQFGAVFLTNRLDGKLYIAGCDTHPPIPQCSASVSIQLPGPIYGVAANNFTHHIFVVGETANQEVLYVIDRQTDQLAQTLPLGTADEDEGGQGILSNPTTNRVYVSNYADGTLTVIQDTQVNLPTETPTSSLTVTPTATNTPTETNTPLLSPTPTPTYPPVFGPYVLTTVPVGIHPKSAAIENPRDRQVFTALFDSSQLQIIDESNYHQYGTVGTSGLHPNQVVRGAPFTFDITNRDSNSLTVLDWRVPGPACTAPTGNLPWGVTYNPTNRRIYVANFGLPKESGSISVFDEQCNRVKTIPLPNDRPALMTEMNGYVYAAGWGTGNLYIIDGNNVVTSPINVGPGAFGLAANPVQSRLYLTNRLTGRLYIILAGGGNANISIVVTLPSPGYAVAANPNLSHTFVVSAVSDQIFAVDGNFGGLIYSLPVGHQDADQGGQGIVVNTHSNRVYVTNYADGTLTVIQDIVTYPQPPPPCLPNCGVPALASPPNGARIKQHVVSLDWTDAPTITRYEIAVKQGSTTGPTVASSKSLTVSKFTTRPLTPGKTYYWRVRACTAKGCNAWTNWWRFLVSN